MRGEGHYRLYMPVSEERNIAKGFFTLMLFVAIAFGAIIGSAYLYGTLKGQLKDAKKEKVELPK